MPLPMDEQNFLRGIKPPAHDVCRARGNEFCARAGFSAAQFGDALRSEYGRCGRSTILLYLRGDLANHQGRAYDTLWMDARVWDYCNRHWPKEKDRTHAEPLLATRGYQKLRECFEAAIDEGVNSLIYGPPSAEKSFVLEELVAQRRAAGKPGSPPDALYVYCEPDISPFPLLKRICREAQVWVPRAWTRDCFMSALIEAFDARPYPPALIFDEAQHLPVESLNTIRALHDRTRRRARAGCGFILAGSHNLYRDFMTPSRRPRLEQMLSRLPNRVQLEGMTRAEVIEIAARAWGNGKKATFTAAHEERLLAACTVEDPYATDADGRPLLDGKGRQMVRSYYSARRLLHYVRQQKKNVKSVLAEAVA